MICFFCQDSGTRKTNTGKQTFRIESGMKIEQSIYPEMKIEMDNYVQKRKEFRLCFWGMLWLFPFSAMAQRDILNLDEFSVFKSGNQVFVRFAISAGNTCEGIQIWRATGKNPFEIVHQIPGVCGSDSVSILYVEEDKSPVFNQDVMYKLQFGNLGFSETVKRFLVNTKGIGQLSIQKESEILLYFENPNLSEMAIRIYEPGGKFLEERFTRGESFTIPIQKFPRGLVFFILSELQNGNSTLGKWLIP
jgi:hypothetical protein